MTFPVAYGTDPQQVADTSGNYSSDGDDGHPTYTQATAFVAAPDGSIVVALYSSNSIGRLDARDMIGMVGRARQQGCARAAHLRRSSLGLMRTRSRVLSVATVAVLCLGLAGCGEDEPADDSDAMAMDMSMMNDPDATPADQVDGDVTSGSFAVLDTAPPGSEGVTGEAWLAQNDEGSTVTIRLEGLARDTEYVSHLHEQACADDNGGEHFKFDSEGSDVPPNEVHLGFTSDADGNGEATITSDREVGDAAPAVVVHPSDAMDNRLACADFS